MSRETRGSITVEVISACTSHPKYLSCVTSWVNFWSATEVLVLGRRISFIPTIYFVGKSVPYELGELSEHIKLLECDGPFDVLLAQSVRLFALPESTHQFAMMSDIDMLPLNQRATAWGLRALVANPEALVVLRDVLEEHSEIPICYNMAQPQTWSKVLSHYNDGTFDQKIAHLLDEAGKNLTGYDGAHGGLGWTTDQRILFDCVNDPDLEIQVIRPTDRETGHKRLDRAKHPFPLNWLVLPLVFWGHYTDYHVHHPISKHKRFVAWLFRAVTRTQLHD
jgi:hypothetical protein